MLKELRHYDNLGTPAYYFQLLKTLNAATETEWKINDINQFFYNKIIDDRRIFDGCIELAIKIKLLLVQNDCVVIDVKLSDYLQSEVQMMGKFVEYLFKALANDEEFHKIFNTNYLSYDVIYKTFQINNNAFGFKYRNFKQLLIDFDVIRYHPAQEIKKYIINSRYKKLLDRVVLPEIKKRILGLEELKKAFEIQQIYGEEAEKYVLTFEKRRLNGNESIAWVAEYIANEGYDIASFDNANDSEYNRFIEVKSYLGERPYFYWSKNEYLVAKRRQESYWLYLVNRNEIGNDDYVPLMYQNPYESILKNSKWIAQVEKYRLEWSE